MGPPRAGFRSTLPGVDAQALVEIAAHAWRPAAEFGLLLEDPVFWGRGVPRGDGPAVLVLPGLFAGDRYLQPLRGWLGRVGYRPVLSGLARNPGWSESLVRELGALAERESWRTGRPVTIIGHSMGGVMARSIALRQPHTTRHVITLGSPLSMTPGRLPAGGRLPVGTKEEPAMPSDGRGRVRFVSIAWVVWPRLALGTLGYFVSLGI